MLGRPLLRKISVQSKLENADFNRFPLVVLQPYELAKCFIMATANKESTMHRLSNELKIKYLCYPCLRGGSKTAILCIKLSTKTKLVIKFLLNLSSRKNRLTQHASCSRSALAELLVSSRNILLFPDEVTQ